MKEKGVEQFGIHSFLCSNTVTNDYYPMLARTLFELCVELMMSENVEELKKDGKIIRVYDSCCGTGGMLTTMKR